MSFENTIKFRVSNPLQLQFDRQKFTSREGFTCLANAAFIHRLLIRSLLILVVLWWSNQWAKGVLTDPQKWKGEYGWLLPVKKGTFVPSKYHQIFSNINTHPYIWPDFWKPYRQIDLFRPTVYFRPKTISKVAIIKTKSATIVFFSSPPFFLLALSFFPFLCFRWCDFGAYRALKTCLLKAFHSNGCRFRSVGFQKIGYTYIHTNVKQGVKSKSHIHRWKGVLYR